MWFLDSSNPKVVNAYFVVESFDFGYQKTTMKLKVSNTITDSSGEEKVAEPEPTESLNSFTVVIPFPWSGNKENGSLQILKNDSSVPVTIHDSIRKLKKVKDASLITIREMWDTYVEEDYGCFTFNAKVDVEYTFVFKYKISIFSTLFVPTRLSAFHLMSNPIVNYVIDVIGNSSSREIQKFLVKNGSSNKYSYSEGKEDVFFHTTNWASSDDEI